MGLLEERRDLVRDAVAFKKTDRLPTYSNFWTFMIHDAGMKLSEALYDYDMLFEAATSFHVKYNFDYYTYLGQRNPFRVTEAVEGNRYIINDDIGSLSIVDKPLMMEDEYEQLIKNPQGFFLSVVIPRKCPAMAREGSFEAMLKAMGELDTFNAYVAKVNGHFREVFEVPNRAGASATVPFEPLFNYLRGIQGISIDMRRRPSQLRDAIAALEKHYNTQASFEQIKAPTPENQIFGFYQTFLGHSICNPKQFGEFYWPYLKKWTDLCYENGKYMQLHTEAQLLTFADYFQQIPKGVLLSQAEMDDPFVMRKRLPNIAIVGGMTPDYLGRRSVAECLERAKRLTGELGEGLVMGQNKMISFPNDAKPENILAVQEYCATYSN
ncbi:MAG: hypothetical protein FWG10_03805 [Eubacteriaceae bacterium]|nr:hypothetical protein [Eubacteriaceae bacterium]